jgi:hypothetical protein
VTLRDGLHDAIVRVVFAREAVELGEYAVAAHILRDLECDLVGALDRDAEETAS